MKPRKKAIITAVIIFGVWLAGLGLLIFLAFSVYGGPTLPGKSENFESWKNKISKVLGSDFSIEKLMNVVQPNYIRVFLKDDITPEQKSDFEQFIKNMPEVSGVEYISKDQALKDFKEWYKDSAAMINEIEGNPLPAEFQVSVKDGYDKGAIAVRFESRPEVSVDESGQKEIRVLDAISLREATAMENEMVAKRQIALWSYVGVSTVILALFLVAYDLIRRRRSSAASDSQPL